MRGSRTRKFCLMGCTIDKGFFFFFFFFSFFCWWEGGSKYHYKRAIIGPQTKRHLNGVLLLCWWWPNIEYWLGQGIRARIAKKPYIFVIFSAGGGPDPLPSPSGPAHGLVAWYRSYASTSISFSGKPWNELSLYEVLETIRENNGDAYRCSVTERSSLVLRTLNETQNALQKPLQSMILFQPMFYMKHSPTRQYEKRSKFILMPQSWIIGLSFLFTCLTEWSSLIMVHIACYHGKI